MKVTETEQQRRYRLAREFEGSGETRARFAERVGVAPWTLDYYRRRLRQQEAPVRLVAVEPGGGASENAAQLVLVLGEALRVEVGPRFEAETLRRLLAALERGR